MWGEPIAKGKAKRDPSLGELQVYASPALAIGDDVDHMLDWVRPSLALYIGGMGAKGQELLQTISRCATATKRPPRRSRISTSRARRTKPPQQCRTNWFAQCR